MSDRSAQHSIQEQLIKALYDDDLKTFELLLNDPNVDHDYWYGEPYWSTCLSLACSMGRDNFVLALLRMCNRLKHNDSISNKPDKYVIDFSERVRELHYAVNNALKNINSKDGMANAEETIGYLQQASHLMEEYHNRMEEILVECLDRVQLLNERVDSIQTEQKNSNKLLSDILNILQKPKV